MANNYFDFIGQNASGEEKKEAPQPTQAMANVTVRVDANSLLLCDGEYMDMELAAGKMVKIQVPIGQHLFEFLYTEDPDIKIEKEVDFPEAGKSYLVMITGLKDLVDATEAEAQAKAAEAEAKKKAEEAKRKAEEAKRQAEEEVKRKVEEAKRKAEEAKRQAEENAKRKVEEAKRKAEEKVKRREEEEAKRRAEEEAKRRAEEEAKRNGHEWVDLGLPSGVKWATCNVGASSPEDSGSFFAWGETTSKIDFWWKNYKQCRGTNDTLTKYCTKSSYGYNGFIDNKTVLDMSNDAARVNWGGNWRIPTRDELYELYTKCTWTRTKLNDVKGHKVTGPNGNSIFVPFAGRYFGKSIVDRGIACNLWSSSLNSADSRYVYSLFVCYSVEWKQYERINGFSVRAVCQ